MNETHEEGVIGNASSLRPLRVLRGEGFGSSEPSVLQARDLLEAM